MKYNGQYWCGETGQLHTFRDIEAPSKDELPVILGELSQSVILIKTAYSEQEIRALKGDKEAVCRLVKRWEEKL